MDKNNNKNSFALLYVQANGECQRIKPRGETCDQLCERILGTAPDFTYAEPDHAFVFFMRKREAAAEGGGDAINVIPTLALELVSMVVSAATLTDELSTCDALIIGRQVPSELDLDVMHVIAPHELEKLEQRVQMLAKVQRAQKERTAHRAQYAEAIAALKRIYGTDVQVQLDDDEPDVTTLLAPMAPFPIMRAAPAPMPDEREDSSSSAIVADEEASVFVSEEGEGDDDDDGDYEEISSTRTLHNRTLIDSLILLTVTPL